MRLLNSDEIMVVEDFFNSIEHNLAENVLGEHVLAMGGNYAPDAVCLLVPGVADQIGFETADHAGLRIGSLNGDHFGIDLQGALIMAPHTLRMRVQVRHKSAQAFLYGKAILGDGVKRHDKKLQPGDHCLVLDGHNDCLGIGEVIGKFKGLAPAIIPVHDLGTYLREQ